MAAGSQINRSLVAIVCLSLTVLVLLGIIIFLAVDRGEQPTCDCKSAAASNLKCQGDWTLHQGRCYYFSKEEKNWNASQNFCSSHNATLAIIENEEKDFVMRLKGKDIFWIGLQRDPSEQWKGPNGENATLEVLGKGGDCAYLNDEAKASAARCSIEHRWICIKVGLF